MSLRGGMDVLIVGGGRLGTALGSLISKSGRRAVVFVRRQEQAREINKSHTNDAYLPKVPLDKGLEATTDLSAAIRDAPIVLMAVPSQSFREAARAVGDTLEADQLVVHATKGFEIETFKRMSQIVHEETCTLKIGVLSGPTIAGEVASGSPTGALLASRFDEVIARVQVLFEGSHLRVYGGRDVVGTEVAGAFKNVIAIAAGAVDGLQFGNNTKWLIVSRGLNEMAQLGTAMGGDVLTYGGLAGIGDLGATCASPLSLSHQIGRRLAEGQELSKILDDLPNTAEAVPTAMAVHRHATSTGLDLPIARSVFGLLHEGWSVKKALDHLMSIRVGRELAALHPR